MRMTDSIRIYVAHRMTGRFMDELCSEAALTTRVLQNYGFEALDPIVQEEIPNVHDVLTQISEEKLRQRWKDDKTAMKDADLLLDYMSMNQSDGVNVEAGYVRFALWKPVVRIWPNVKLAVSRIEYDDIVPSLIDAVELINEKYGTYEKLGSWREAMLNKSFLPWIQEQHKMNGRYGIHGGFNIL